MNDITALMATMKAAAEKASNDDWVKESGDGWEAICSTNDQANGGFIIAHFEGQDAAANREFVQAASPANVKTLVEVLEKAQQSVELVDLQRDKIKRLESDLWDKEQLRKVHSEKSFELEGKVRELEARNQKDFVWRGEEISRLNDEVDELKERLESRTVTVKLTDVNEYLAEVHDKTLALTFRRLAEGVRAGDIAEMTAAGIQVIEGEQKNG